MAVTYYIKLFRREADRDNGILMSLLLLVAEAQTRANVKKVFLEISQNSQENTCARASFLIKLQACLQLF